MIIEYKCNLVRRSRPTLNLLSGILGIISGVGMFLLLGTYHWEHVLAACMLCLAGIINLGFYLKANQILK